MSRRDIGRWTINGRYLTQPVTGVQRYAREIVAALAMAIDGDDRGPLLRIVRPPRGADEHVTVDAFAEPVAAATHTTRSAMPVDEVGRGAGHRWEQLSLPAAVGAEGLLCLANTGPLSVRRQILCMHDAHVHTFPASYAWSFRVAYRLLQPMLGRRVAALTTVSRTSADLLIAHKVASHRDIEVLPNGHEHVWRWQPQRSRLFDREPPQRPYLLLIGSRAPHKNMRRVFSLADELAALGIDLYVSGRVDAIYSSVAGANATPARGGAGGAADNIRELGFVSDDDLALLYRHALALVFPSHVEGFGLPLVEAMALGCPVIAANASCLPEIGGDAALYADPDDGAQWLAAIKRLAGSPSLREELTARGRERVHRYAWAASAAGYRELMQRL